MSNFIAYESEPGKTGFILKDIIDDLLTCAACKAKDKDIVCKGDPPWVCLECHNGAIDLSLAPADEPLIVEAVHG